MPGPEVAAATTPAPPLSFEAFYLREYRRVVQLAYALSGSRTGAEDLAQEAFMAAHGRWAEIGQFEHPGAWVRKVAANLASSAVRRRLAEGRALLRLAGRREAAALGAMAEPDADFWRAVRALPRRQAQAVALFYLEDQSVATIAQVLDCAEGTVKALLHQCRRALAARLKLDDDLDTEEVSG